MRSVETRIERVKAEAATRTCAPCRGPLAVALKAPRPTAPARFCRRSAASIPGRAKHSDRRRATGGFGDTWRGAGPARHELGPRGSRNGSRRVR